MFDAAKVIQKTEIASHSPSLAPISFFPEGRKFVCNRHLLYLCTRINGYKINTYESTCPFCRRHAAVAWQRNLFSISGSPADRYSGQRADKYSQMRPYPGSCHSGSLVYLRILPVETSYLYVRPLVPCRRLLCAGSLFHVCRTGLAALGRGPRGNARPLCRPGRKVHPGAQRPSSGQSAGGQ